MHRTGNAATRSIAGSPSFSETSSFLLTRVPAALGAFSWSPRSSKFRAHEAVTRLSISLKLSAKPLDLPLKLVTRRLATNDSIGTAAWRNVSAAGSKIARRNTVIGLVSECCAR